MLSTEGSLLLPREQMLRSIHMDDPLLVSRCPFLIEIEAGYFSFCNMNPDVLLFCSSVDEHVIHTIRSDLDTSVTNSVVVHKAPLLWHDTRQRADRIEVL